MRNLFIFLTILLLASCGNKPATNVPLSDAKPDSCLSLKYAKGFSVDFFKGYQRVTVWNPWQPGAIFARYYLTRDSLAQIPGDGIRIQIPLKSLASASCTHYTFLEMLGVSGTVTGVCNAKLVYNSLIRQSYKESKVVDLGDPFQIKVERCLMLKPQAVMVTGYNQLDEHLARLSDAGIPVIYNNEWMESTLLARAEWIRFVACFYGKGALADSLYQEVESNYLRLKKMAAKAVTPKPKVLSGDNFRGTWYLPGGRSFTAELFSDAGANYIYKNDTTAGSIPYSFEQVLRDLNDADVWVGATNAATLSELLNIDERYKLFKSFREAKVYCYMNKVTPEGGNDYWESAVAYPDRLLADFIKLFHPELLPDYSWFYLKKMN
ncbi:MAG: ABC transporter substrate-binding protein [Bacteroidales bacterium]|nr:ABC transporter substrate-binding protein [Bacteroidales bacterium]